MAATLGSRACAAESWQAALAGMPLDVNAAELNRTNCIPLLLNAFQSNAVVKAIIVMPGAADEFYFFRRAHPALSAPNPSLMDAVTALTNQTYIRADFHPPFLLLHTTEDALDPIAIAKNKSTASKLQARMVLGRLIFNDCGWDDLRSKLRGKLGVGLRPFSNAPESWHFYRYNFAACGLSQWQLLEAIALAGKDTFTVHWLTADFKLDNRFGPVPELKSFPGT